MGPALSGFLVQRTGNYLMPFGITSAVCVLGVIAWLVIVGRVEPIIWRVKAKSAIATARAQA
jgi:hypothetical protein